MAVGTSCLESLPTTLDVPGYIASLIVLTAGYSLFLAANNIAAMTNSGPLEPGFISGILNFSRFLGLITGASVMGNVFALASSSTNTPQARRHRHEDHLRRRNRSPPRRCNHRRLGI